MVMDGSIMPDWPVFQPCLTFVWIPSEGKRVAERLHVDLRAAWQSRLVEEPLIIPGDEGSPATVIFGMLCEALLLSTECGDHVNFVVVTCTTRPKSNPSPI